MTENARTPAGTTAGTEETTPGKKFPKVGSTAAGDLPETPGVPYPDGYDRTLAGSYRWLMFGGGFLQLVIGLGLVFLVEFILIEQISLAYPYLSINLLIGLELFAILGLVVPGGLVFVGGFWAGKFATLPPEQIRTQYNGLRKFVMVGSIWLIPGIPFGTLVGVNLLREMWLLKYPA